MSERWCWHLCWLAAYGHNFLSRPELAAWVRQRLLAAHQHRGRVLVDFLLLPCEVHSLSRLRDEEDTLALSREIGSSVARRLRREGGIDGPVLRGRYMAHWLETDDDVREEVRMLAWRPVVAGICRSPAYYTHGAYPMALGRSGVDGFDIRPMLDLFGAPLTAARHSLRRFAGRRPTPEQLAHWELTRGYVSANACMERLAEAPGGARADNAARLIAAAGKGLDGALSVLESFARLHLPRSQDAPGPAADQRCQVRVRALVACLAVDHGLCSAAELARRLRRSKSTLSEQMAACRTRPHEAMLLETPVQQIILEVMGRGTVRRLP